MDYVRDHIRRYTKIAFRRTLGIGLVTLCVMLAIGLVFTTLSDRLLFSGFGYLVFWIILIAMAAFTFLSSIVRSHIASVRYMNEKEHSAHSTHLGLWIIFSVLGVILFILPLLFVSSYLEPITLLFSFGGAMIVVFITVMLVFKHSYGELAIGGAALWFMCALGLLELSSSALNVATKNSFSLYFAAMTLTIVAGFVGLTLLFNSTRESLYELTLVMNKIDKEYPKKHSSPARKKK